MQRLFFFRTSSAHLGGQVADFWTTVDFIAQLFSLLTPRLSMYSDVKLAVRKGGIGTTRNKLVYRQGRPRTDSDPKHDNINQHPDRPYVQSCCHLIYKKNSPTSLLPSVEVDVVQKTKHKKTSASYKTQEMEIEIALHLSFLRGCPQYHREKPQELCINRSVTDRIVLLYIISTTSSLLLKESKMTSNNGTDLKKNILKRISFLAMNHTWTTLK